MFRLLGLLALLALGLVLLPHAPALGDWFAATSLAQLALLFAVGVALLRAAVVWRTLGGFTRRQNLLLAGGLGITTTLVAATLVGAGTTSAFALLVGLGAAAVFWRMILDMIADEVHFRAQHTEPAPTPLPTLPRARRRPPAKAR